MLVQTRRIALHEDSGPRRWDSVKSCCTECCIEQWISIVTNYLQSVYFLFSSNPMFKVVELQKMSRIWSQSCPCVDILSKLQIAASYQIFLMCTEVSFKVPFMPSLLPRFYGPLRCVKYFCLFTFFSRSIFQSFRDATVEVKWHTVFQDGIITYMHRNYLHLYKSLFPKVICYFWKPKSLRKFLIFCEN